jgi:hypothetical protein
MTSVSPPIQSVLALFKGPLAQVRFADIDAAGLAALAVDVESAAVDVQTQEAKLAELRQGLAQRQEALLVLAQQALAYARVYAETDDALLEELNRISLPRATKARKAGAPKSAGAQDVTAPQASAEAAPSAERAEGAALETEEPAQPVEAAPARSSRKVGKGRLSRAFTREESA